MTPVNCAAVFAGPSFAPWNKEERCVRRGSMPVEPMAWPIAWRVREALIFLKRSGLEYSKLDFFGVKQFSSDSWRFAEMYFIHLPSLWLHITSTPQVSIIMTRNT